MKHIFQLCSKDQSVLLRIYHERDAGQAMVVPMKERSLPSFTQFIRYLLNSNSMSGTVLSRGRWKCHMSIEWDQSNKIGGWWSEERSQAGKFLRKKRNQINLEAGKGRLQQTVGTSYVKTQMYNSYPGVWMTKVKDIRLKKQQEMSFYVYFSEH